MLRGRLASPGFKGQFSGHETFPLRYGWLNKVFDAVSAKPNRNGNLFSKDQAIAEFGVGKNMVASMKHWALTSGIIKEEDGSFQVTELGNSLMGASGFDPYLESPASLWLLHWKIASNIDRATTWHWAFGYHSSLVFDQEHMTSDIYKLVQDQDWKRIAPTTVKRDVECFIKTYTNASKRSPTEVTEDSLESPLAELALIKPTGFRGSYQFQRGPKPSLPDGIFAYALGEFWRWHTDANTLSIEAATYEPGSPGRLFKLDETAVLERLVRIDEVSDEALRWTDTAGLSQVMRTEKRLVPKKLLSHAFRSMRQLRKAA